MPVLAVPVKPLELAKSRLSPLLAPAERAALAMAMAEDVLGACLEQQGWSVWVLSRDEAVLSMAGRRGARAFAERSTSLQGAIKEAEAAAGQVEMAVVLADLPLLTARGLAVALSANEPVVAGRALSDGGTNLLVRRPAGVIPARFGRDSFVKHAWAARRARVGFSQVDLPELAFDLDRPGDVERLLAASAGGRARAACIEMGLAERLRARA
jgi:2-phospho-L-lactate guanylyltransferase